MLSVAFAEVDLRQVGSNVQESALHVPSFEMPELPETGTLLCCFPLENVKSRGGVQIQRACARRLGVLNILLVFVSLYLASSVAPKCVAILRVLHLPRRSDLGFASALK